MADEVPNYTIRQMRTWDIPAVVKLWRDTGLGEGTYSIDTFYKYDPKGFFVAATADDTVIGACAGVLQNKDLAFVGLNVVKRSYRKRGIGRKILNAVMERIGDRNTGVNVVPDQLENYRDKYGFPIQTSWCSMVCKAPSFLTSQLCCHLPEVHVLMFSSTDDDLLKKIVLYDADVCGFTREGLIQLVCRQKDSVTRVAIKDADGEVCGYGNIMKNIKGNASIGPLYADSGDIAEKILYELIKAFPLAEEKGSIIIPIDRNPSMFKISEKLGLVAIDIIGRLYTKKEVDVKFEKIFAQSNLNFSIF